MNESTPIQEQPTQNILGELLRTNRAAMLLEIVVGLLQAIIFGLAHAYQGPIGVFKTAAIGLLFGFAYLAVGRNLWPLILAHGLIDSIDMVTHYFGG